MRQQKLPGVLIPSLRRGADQGHRTWHILGNTVAMEQRQAEFVHGRGIAGIRCLLKVRSRPRDVLLNAVTRQQAQPYRVDRRNVTLLCGVIVGREAVRFTMRVVLKLELMQRSDDARLGMHDGTPAAVHAIEALQGSDLLSVGLAVAGMLREKRTF